jgi:hypothetical protein
MSSEEDCVEMIPTDDPEAIAAFWKREFAKFIRAKTEREAVAALAAALRSEWAMSNDFRLTLAAMLEGLSPRLSYPSWTIRAVKRRDADITKIQSIAWKHYKEVQELINNGMSKTGACKEVAGRRNKEQRAIEISYNKHANLVRRLIEEPLKRAEAAAQRSRTLRENRGFRSHPEDDPSS